MSGDERLVAMSAGELLSAYRERDLSPVEVVEACLDRIEERDDGLGAFTTLCAERALDEAADCERAYRTGGDRGVLAGVPFGVKDLFDTAGVTTAYGSPMFADHVPEADAAALARVRSAGAVMVGKTQTHEFAWGLAEYLDAIAARERLRATAEALFERVDVLLSPVSACSPIPIGDERTVHFGIERDFRELVMPYTVPQDLLGLPACTARAGFDELGISIGIQFTARRGNDRAALAAASALFAATPSVQEHWPGDQRSAGGSEAAERRVRPSV